MASTRKRSLTKEEQALYRAAAMEPVNWIPKHCAIINVEGQMVSLEPNTRQLQLLRLEAQARRDHKPLRVIILKSRQHGITTLGLGLQYYWCNTRPNFRALCSAHEEKQGEIIFERVKMYQSQNPNKLKTTTERSDTLSFADPMNSSMRVATAGKENLARGETLLSFWGSEVAFWPYPEKTLAAVNQAIHRVPGSSIFLESTACGRGGAFYERWDAAVRGKSGYIPIFFGWYQDPTRWMECEPDFEATYEEQLMAREYGLSNEQLRWRRAAIMDECGGDEDLFHQEYPSHPAEAFLVSGRPVFPAGKLMQMEKHTAPPIATGEFWIRSNQRGEFNRQHKGCADIYEHPQEQGVYVIGADPAEGIKEREAKNPDASSAVVLDVRKRRVVAHIHGQLDPETFGRQIAAAGLYYNRALLGVEINNTSGGATREVLKRLKYPRLYHRKRYEHMGLEFTEIIGWNTDKSTRNMMVSDLNNVLRGDGIVVPAERILKQMRAFIWDDKGKPIAQPGDHDDDVFALMLAWQMCIEAAKTLDRGEIVYEASRIRQEKQDLPRPPRELYDEHGQYDLTRLGYRNAVDYALDVLEEEDVTV